MVPHPKVIQKCLRVVIEAYGRWWEWSQNKFSKTKTYNQEPILSDFTDKVWVEARRKHAPKNFAAELKKKYDKSLFIFIGIDWEIEVRLRGWLRGGDIFRISCCWDSG